MAKDKDNGAGTALAVLDLHEYAIVQSADDIGACLAANLDGERLSGFDLSQVRVPGGGGTTWQVPSLGGEEDCKELVGLIVHISKRRAYWSGGDPTGDPPDCVSVDMLKGVGD